MIRFIWKVVLTNILTVYYSAKVLFMLGLYQVTHPFSNPWTPQLRLMPPDILKHPKYGVHKYLKVNNVKIHYVESGDSSKPLMVFVHGYPEFWYSWRHQIVHFNKDYWCVAIDMRGYADSEKPAQQSAYKVQHMADDLRDLVRQLGREKFIMIAHDWGGAVGWHYRDTYPETISAYLSFGSSTLHSLHKLMNEDSEQFNKSWYIFFNRAPWVPELMMSFNNLMVFNQMMKKVDNFVTKEDIECYKYTFGKPGAFTPPINYYRENVRYTLPEKACDELPVPCLFGQCAEDAFLVTKNRDLIRQQYKHVEVVTLDGCGHFCQQENPEQVNNVIREFLQKHNL